MDVQVEIAVDGKLDAPAAGSAAALMLSKSLCCCCCCHCGSAAAAAPDASTAGLLLLPPCRCCCRCIGKPETNFCLPFTVRPRAEPAAAPRNHGGEIAINTAPTLYKDCTKQLVLGVPRIRGPPVAEQPRPPRSAAGRPTPRCASQPSWPSPWRPSTEPPAHQLKREAAAAPRPPAPSASQRLRRLLLRRDRGGAAGRGSRAPCGRGIPGSGASCGGGARRPRTCTPSTWPGGAQRAPGPAPRVLRPTCPPPAARLWGAGARRRKARGRSPVSRRRRQRRHR